MLNKNYLSLALGIYCCYFQNKTVLSFKISVNGKIIIFIALKILTPICKCVFLIYFLRLWKFRSQMSVDGFWPSFNCITPAGMNSLCTLAVGRCNISLCRCTVFLLSPKTLFFLSVINLGFMKNSFSIFLFYLYLDNNNLITVLKISVW